MTYTIPITFNDVLCMFIMFVASIFVSAALFGIIGNMVFMITPIFMMITLILALNSNYGWVKLK